MEILDILDEIVVPTIEIDYYVPITIEFNDNDCLTKDLFYYRILNKDSSFLEFKINSESKKIYGISLVSMNDIKDIAGVATILDSVTVKTGNPLIGTDIWKDTGILTSNENFEITYDGSQLFILPEYISEIDTKIAMPSVDLLIDQNKKVIGCIFNKIPADKKAELEECINSITPKKKSLLKQVGL